MFPFESVDDIILPSNLKLSTLICVATEAPPITTPSTVPPLISAVSATRESILAVPSKYKSLNSAEPVPKSISLSAEGTIAPSVNVTCAAPAAETVMTSEPENVIAVLVSPSPVIESN